MSAKITDIENKLTICPDCCRRLKEVKENHYKCPGCNARVEQLTIYNIGGKQ